MLLSKALSTGAGFEPLHAASPGSSAYGFELSGTAAPFGGKLFELVQISHKENNCLVKTTCAQSQPLCGDETRLSLSFSLLFFSCGSADL